MANEFARQLRHNQTDAEKFLWQKLRNRNLIGVKFRRQYPLGDYIVDFICIEHKLIIELDGSQHMDQQNYDTKRSEFLKLQGYEVLRFWNNQVLLESESVLQEIYNFLNK